MTQVIPPSFWSGRGSRPLGYCSRARKRRSRRRSLRAGLPAALIPGITAMADMNPANANVAVGLDVTLVKLEAAGDLFAFGYSVFALFVRSLLRFEGFILGEFSIRHIVDFGALTLFRQCGH